MVTFPFNSITEKVLNSESNRYEIQVYSLEISLNFLCVTESHYVVKPEGDLSYKISLKEEAHPMKKKLLALVLLFVLVFSVAAPGIASACGYVSPETARYNQAIAIINSANAKIRSLVLTAQITPYNDIAWLISSTNAVAANAKARVAQLGYEVGCNYINYWVDGRWVAIDPLYVINPRPSGGETDR